MDLAHSDAEVAAESPQPQPQLQPESQPEPQPANRHSYPTTEVLPEFALRSDLQQQGFRIRADHLQDGGRCLVREAPLKAGEILFREFGIVSALRPDQIAVRCDRCWLPPSAGQILRRCSGCKAVRYCSEDCQRSAWGMRESGDHSHGGGHKLECKLLQAVQKRRLRHQQQQQQQKPQQPQQQPAKATDLSSISPLGLPTTMMLVRLWIYARNCPPAARGNALARMEALSHRAEALPEDRRAEYWQVVLAVNAWLEETGLDGSAAGSAAGDGADEESEVAAARKQRLDTLFLWLCRLNINCHTVTTDDFMQIGIGLYPCLAMLNHSCAANCSIIFYGPYVEVRALRDFPAGEPLTLPYVDVAQATARRQKELAEGYFFDCTCQLCLESPEQRARDALLEAWAPGDAVTAERLDEARAQVDRLLKPASAGGVAAAESSQRAADAQRIAQLQTARRLLQEQLGAGHANQDLLGCLRELANLLIYAQAWPEALQAAEQLLAGSELVFTGPLDRHPVLGLDRLMVARLRDYAATMPSEAEQRRDPAGAMRRALAQLRENAGVYTKALEVLDISHGERTGIVRTAHESLERCQRDAGFLEQQLQQYSSRGGRKNKSGASSGNSRVEVLK